MAPPGRRPEPGRLRPRRGRAARDAARRAGRPAAHAKLRARIGTLAVVRPRNEAFIAAHYVAGRRGRGALRARRRTHARPPRPRRVRDVWYRTTSRAPQLATSHLPRRARVDVGERDETSGLPRRRGGGTHVASMCSRGFPQLRGTRCCAGRPSGESGRLSSQSWIPHGVACLAPDTPVCASRARRCGQWTSETSSSPSGPASPAGRGIKRTSPCGREDVPTVRRLVDPVGNSVCRLTRTMRRERRHSTRDLQRARPVRALPG